MKITEKEAEELCHKKRQYAKYGSLRKSDKKYLHKKCFFRILQQGKEDQELQKHKVWELFLKVIES